MKPRFPSSAMGACLPCVVFSIPFGEESLAIKEVRFLRGLHDPSLPRTSLRRLVRLEIERGGQIPRRLRNATRIGYS
jgi:hypothetical protein